MIFRKTIVLAALIMATSCGATNEKYNESPTETSPADYVSTLVGSLSSFEISTGNTYPAIALPWGMNFWTPQTGKMGDGWTYRYDAHRIRGIKQTHQPSPWINDYGQFSIMPVRDVSKTDEEARASWFSHQSETAKPYYYSVYLADHDVKAEVAPSDRAAVLRFTFPDSKNSGVIADAFDKGSYIKVIPEEQTIVGYTTRNSGGVPENFRNWFVMKFDRPFESVQVYNGKDAVSGNEFEGEHALAAVKFATRRGDKVNVAVASSFISLEQAYTNLREVEGKDLEAVKADAKARWNDILGRIEVSGGHVLLLPIQKHPLPSQVLRDRQERQNPALQPVQRQSMRGLHVHRHGLLGHFPRPLPAPQPRLPVGEQGNPTRPRKHCQGEPVPARMGQPRTQRLHGRQQLCFCRGRRHNERR